MEFFIKGPHRRLTTNQETAVKSSVYMYSYGHSPYFTPPFDSASDCSAAIVCLDHRSVMVYSIITFACGARNAPIALRRCHNNTQQLLSRPHGFRSFTVDTNKVRGRFRLVQIERVIAKGVVTANFRTYTAYCILFPTGQITIP